MTLQAVEGSRDLRPVGGDRGRRLSILALDVADGIEPLVDLA